MEQCPKCSYDGGWEEVLEIRRTVRWVNLVPTGWQDEVTPVRAVCPNCHAWFTWESWHDVYPDAEGALWGIADDDNDPRGLGDLLEIIDIIGWLRETYEDAKEAQMQARDALWRELEAREVQG